MPRLDSRDTTVYFGVRIKPWRTERHQTRHQTPPTQTLKSQRRSVQLYTLVFERRERLMPFAGSPPLGEHGLLLVGWRLSTAPRQPLPPHTHLFPLRTSRSRLRSHDWCVPRLIYPILPTLVFIFSTNVFVFVLFCVFF